MQAIQILASIDELSAGPSQSVPALANALVREGVDVRIHTLSGWRAPPPAPSQQNVVVVRHALDNGPFGRIAAASSKMDAALKAEAETSDILHTHGMWLAPNYYAAAAIAQRRSRANLVTSPRGMLGKEALSFSRMKKKLAWTVFQRWALERADCLHATAESELHEIRAAGLTNPVAVIPNGITVPTLSKAPFPNGPQRKVLALGRVHPKKGLDRLLRAWATVEPERPHWRLHIAGPPENGHDVELREIARELELKRVTIAGPAFGADKEALYRTADLFVLSSLNENFAMTVAEALSHGVPVISTKGAPWAALGTEGCGWWIDHGPVHLARALLAATALDDETRIAMGARGRAWMMRDYSWEEVGANMLDVYRWLKNGGPTPATVALV